MSKRELKKRKQELLEKKEKVKQIYENAIERRKKRETQSSLVIQSSMNVPDDFFDISQQNTTFDDIFYSSQTLNSIKEHENSTNLEIPSLSLHSRPLNSCLFENQLALLFHEKLEIFRLTTDWQLIKSFIFTSSLHHEIEFIDTDSLLIGGGTNAPLRLIQGDQLKCFQFDNMNSKSSFAFPFNLIKKKDINVILTGSAVPGEILELNLDMSLINRHQTVADSPCNSIKNNFAVFYQGIYDLENQRFIQFPELLAGDYTLVDSADKYFLLHSIEYSKGISLLRHDSANRFYQAKICSGVKVAELFNGLIFCVTSEKIEILDGNTFDILTSFDCAIQDLLISSHANSHSHTFFGLLTDDSINFIQLSCEDHF